MDGDCEVGARLKGQHHTIWRKISIRFEAMLVVGAVLYIATYCVLAGIRIRYPYELEWIEGAVIDSCARLVEGQSVYTKPSLEFVPLLYNPLYLYVSAGMMQVLGVSPLAPRLLSFLASLGCIGVIFLLVRHETGDTESSVTAAGFYAATFGVAGAWFDTAKTDSFFVLFVLAGLYCARRWSGVRGAILAGISLTLAYFTKQPGLVIIGFIGLFYLLEGWKPFTAYSATVIVLGVGTTAALHTTTEGWYTFYTWGIVTQHGLIMPFLYLFWVMDVLGNIPIVALLSALLLLPLAQPFERSAKGLKSRFYLCAVAAGLFVSWLGRLNRGGYLNVLMPMFAVFSVVFGFLLDYLKRYRNRPFSSVSLLLCIIQFAQLFYRPADYAPSVLDEAAGSQFIKTVQTFEGNVFIPYHGYYATSAGKPMHAHWTALADLLGEDYARKGEATNSRIERIREALDTEIQDALRQQDFDAIILDTDYEYWMDRISPYYEYAGQVFEEKKAFWTRVGWRTRPEDIYLPRSKISIPSDP
jgi:4-amino-4-deoxy-L-arabinose transferase-like glycosyltransferase